MGLSSVNGQDLPNSIAQRPGPAPAPPVSITPAEAGGNSDRASATNEEQAQGSRNQVSAVPDPVLQHNRPRLRIDRESQTVVIQIVNAQDEVVKQIPPEDFLKNAEKFRQIQGLLFDRKS
jgi:uncharacterized FlaG/YvyC family protein